ncbi:MAG: glycosyltransferase [Fuscovulum sp.]|nr:MAG: glycosyltransferase [Fuscovulum sp.]
MSLFFLLLSLLCALAVTYPYLLYGRLLDVVPSQPLHPKLGHNCSATLVFCAYNEAASLPQKLDNIAALKLRHPDLEVLAFDDGSSDGSLDLLLSRRDLLTVITGSGRNGKAHGMKQLSARAGGEIIVFTDANVTLREDAIDALMAWYADPQVGGVCGSLIYLGTDSSATAAVGSRYWRLEEKLKSKESRTGNVMGADGSIFSIRRELYPNFPDTVLDDLTVSMHVIFAGLRLIKADDVIAYERIVGKRSDEIARKIRIAARAFHTHVFLRQKLNQMHAVDKFKYSSRKLLRWFGGGFLILAALFAMLAAWLVSPFLALVCLVICAGLILVGLRANKGPMASIMEVIIALLATQLGIIHAVRGRTFSVWSPAKSR